LKNIVDNPKATAMQIERQIIDFSKAVAFEIRIDKSFPHINCNEAGYLEQDTI